MWTLSLAGFAGAARLAWWYWPGGVFSDETSGTWTALAWDFAHGEFYRPVLGSAGYGGTRYMPLFFIAHGLLLRAHLDPIHAGVLLMQSTVLAAALALYAALRTTGVTARLALPFTATVCATILYQRYLTDVRADYLAAAFSLAAVVAAMTATRRERPGWLVCAAALCVLATLTKVTAIFPVAPIALALALRRSTRASVRFVAGVLLGVIAALFVVQLASAGHFVENFRSSLSANMAASALWRHGPQSFAQEVTSDPFIGVPFLLACWCSIAAASRRRWSWAHSYFVMVVGVTLAILASPGTGSNQLVDLQLASTWVVGFSAARRDLSARVLAPAYVALAIGLAIESWPLPGMPSIIRALTEQGPHQRSVIARVHAEFLSAPARYLSTEPIIPVLSDERPLVLDWFNLDRFVKEGAPAGRDLDARIRARAFDAIVLYDIDTFPHDMNAGDAALDARRATDRAKGGALLGLIHSTYEIHAVRKPFVILRPQVASTR